MNTPMRESWHASADAWVAWARSAGHDHFFWRFSRPALLDLLPAPGRRTLDVGCGEGRLARQLIELGHTVVGIEGSTRLAEVARATDPPFEVIVADAAAMPLEDASADLAVACMSLLNFDDLRGALREIARVLEPGGRFAFVTVHPSNAIVNARRILDEGISYFDEHDFAEPRERDGLRMVFHDAHRPLQDLLGAVLDAGLTLERIREPVPDASYVADFPEVARWRRDPCFLLGLAVKPG
jgi:SAM-dependent methyltransferase